MDPPPAFIPRYRLPVLLSNQAELQSNQAAILKLSLDTAPAYAPGSAYHDHW